MQPHPVFVLLKYFFRHPVRAKNDKWHSYCSESQSNPLLQECPFELWLFLFLSCVLQSCLSTGLHHIRQAYVDSVSRSSTIAPSLDFFFFFFILIGRMKNKGWSGKLFWINCAGCWPDQLSSFFLYCTPVCRSVLTWGHPVGLSQFTFILFACRQKPCLSKPLFCFLFASVLKCELVCKKEQACYFHCTWSGESFYCRPVFVAAFQEQRSSPFCRIPTKWHGVLKQKLSVQDLNPIKAARKNDLSVEISEETGFIFQMSIGLVLRHSWLRQRALPLVCNSQSVTSGKERSCCRWGLPMGVAKSSTASHTG